MGGEHGFRGVEVRHVCSIDRVSGRGGHEGGKTKSEAKSATKVRRKGSRRGRKATRPTAKKWRFSVDSLAILPLYFARYNDDRIRYRLTII